jgi:prepilin-type N-terminal cleavage/methylation domain-containing protein
LSYAGIDLTGSPFGILAGRALCKSKSWDISFLSPFDRRPEHQPLFPTHLPLKPMKHTPTTKRAHQHGAFTLIEALITIAVIGIMAALVITKISNAAHDTRRVIARQQMAAMQTAVNNWVATESSKTSIDGAKSAYNAKANSKERLALVSSFLDVETYNHFLSAGTSTTQIKSEALAKIGKYLTLESWADGSYPKVELKP